MSVDTRPTVNFNYVKSKSYLNDHNHFNEGDIVFCEEDKKIYVKMGSTFQSYGGQEYEIPKLEDVEFNDTPYVRMNRDWSKLFDHVDINLIPRITTPTIISPSENATDINQAPLIVGSQYSHTFGIKMNGKSIQIATSNTFDEDTIVYENTIYSTNTDFQVQLKQDNTSYLNSNTTYYVRIRYHDITDTISDWSEPLKFTTLEVFEEDIYFTPRFIAPNENGRISYKKPVLILTPPVCTNPEIVFDKSEWQISMNRAFDDNQIIFNNVSSEPTTISIQNDIFAHGIASDYFVRARQGTTTGEWTPWSVICKFNIMHDYDSITFGFRRIFNPAYQEPLIYNIDEDGNIITLSADYFDNHPLYQNTEKVTILNYYKGTDTAAAAEYDRGYWAIIPLCYFKYKVYENEDNALVIDEWFTTIDKSSDGQWQIHPAFVKNLNPIYIQKQSRLRYNRDDKHYYAFDGSSQMNSMSSSAFSYSAYVDETSPNSYIGKSIADINPGLGTPHMYNLYEYMLIRDLMLAESKTFKCGPSKSWHNLNNIICDTGYNNSDGNIMYINNIITHTKNESKTEKFQDKETGQMLNNIYNEGSTTSYTITSPTGGAFIDIPITGLTTITRNDAPSNKTNFPIKDSYFKVKGIARGFYEILGFDITLLMIANQFEEVDSSYDSNYRPFGFPSKLRYQHANQSGSYYGIPTTVQRSSGDSRSEHTMLGHSGIIPCGGKTVDSMNNTFYWDSKLCMYS